MRTRLFVVFLSLLTPQWVGATAFESGEQQTGLLELYTSEGCSSCPPADKWLSTLKEKDGLWQDFIPLAFHVDYWDYIGWKDRFAQPTFTARQRLHAREQLMRTIYTPGFIYNGKEWKQWFMRRYFDFPDAQRVGKLTTNLVDETVSVEFSPEEFPTDTLQVTVALLGFELETQVKAGENKGEKLLHDFVVLGLRKGELQRHDNHYRGQLPLPGKSQSAMRYALVAWVSPLGRQRPLQAVGGWL